MQMKCFKVWNANGDLQIIWNEFAFEIHWKLHREKVFDSNDKGFALAKTSQESGGWVSQKELTSCNFPSKFHSYSLSQMPSDGKLNCLTISISNSCRIGTDQVLPTHTLNTLLGTYETISLWRISTTCTWYPCRNAVIPFKTTICFKRLRVPGAEFSVQFWKTVGSRGCPSIPCHIKLHANDSARVVSSGFSFLYLGRWKSHCALIVKHFGYVPKKLQE